MIKAIKILRASGYKTAAITNNFAWNSQESAYESQKLAKIFDLVVESYIVHLHKPDVKIYEFACEKLQVKPNQVVFLDDIGRNLKTASALGMITIKVENEDDALAQLEKILNLSLRIDSTQTLAKL